jgi:hypothetical protein
MEAMLHVLRHIYDGTCTHIAVFVSNLNLRPSAHHVIDLILCVRGLRIQASRRKNVESHAEVRDFEKFKIGFVAFFLLGDQIRELEGIHTHIVNYI